jgi:hypothetical protein
VKVSNQVVNIRFFGSHYYSKKVQVRYQVKIYLTK